MGILTLFFKKQLFERITLLLVALSAGALLGAAFLHLMPEALSKGQGNFGVFIWVLAGFVFFFLFEQFIPSLIKTDVAGDRIGKRCYEIRLYYCSGGEK